MQGNQSPPIAYSIDEAARVSGLSKTGLYRLMRAKALPFATVGNRRKILHADLEAFLRSSMEVA